MEMLYYILPQAQRPPAAVLAVVSLFLSPTSMEHTASTSARTS